MEIGHHKEYLSKAELLSVSPSSERMVHVDSPRRRANTRNVSFTHYFWRPIYIINSIDETKLSWNILPFPIDAAQQFLQIPLGETEGLIDRLTN